MRNFGEVVSKYKRLYSAYFKSYVAQSLRPVASNCIFRDVSGLCISSGNGTESKCPYDSNDIIRPVKGKKVCSKSRMATKKELKQVFNTLVTEGDYPDLDALGWVLQGSDYIPYVSWFTNRLYRG